MKVQIKSPSPGPTEPPPPAPVPHVVPHMGTLPPVTPRVWRVKETELDELFEWLVERLIDRWPRLNREGLWAMLRAATGDRLALFLRTENVTGIFEISPGNVLESSPIINERFVRQKGRHMHTKENEQSILLYQYVRDYGRQIGAREFNFGRDTDSSLKPHISSGLQDIRIGSEVQMTTTYRVIYTDI